MIKRLRQLFKNKDAKVLIENFMSLSILKIVGYIFPLITLPYLSKTIGIEKFGIIAFAGSIIVYFQTLVNFGFNYTAIRDIAKNIDNKEKVDKIFSNVMIARLFLLIISILIFTICIYSIPYLRENKIILWFTFLCIPGSIMFPEWYFQAIEKMKYITIINVVSKLFFTILVFVFIKTEDDYIYQPLFIAMGFFVSGLASLYIILNKFKVKFVHTSFKDIVLTLKDSYNMFFCLLLPNLYTNFSIMFLNIISGNVATGIYTSGYSFINLVDQFTEILSRTFYPFLSRRLDKHYIYVKLSFIINAIGSLFLFFGADLLIKIFYTPEFAESANIIRIMSIAPIVLFLMNTYGVNYLVIIGKENILKNIILGCSICGLILSVISIKLLGSVGVACTITLVWTVRGLLTWYYANKYKKRI